MKTGRLHNKEFIIHLSLGDDSLMESGFCEVSASELFINFNCLLDLTDLLPMMAEEAVRKKMPQIQISVWEEVIKRFFSSCSWNGQSFPWIEHDRIGRETSFPLFCTAYTIFFPVYTNFLEYKIVFFNEKFKNTKPCLHSSQRLQRNSS